MARHLRSLMDLQPAEMQRVIELAVAMKAEPAKYRKILDGKSVAVIFAKQSTRTRVSFEVGIHQLGGQPLVLTSGGTSGMQMGRGETIHDTAKTLSRFVHAIVIRTFGQHEVDGLAEHGSVPVVNALTDMYHPCQALADVQTMREHFGDTRGLKLVYAGAGNNVAHSLMLAGPRAGFDVVVACPEQVKPDAKVLERACADAAAAGTKVTVMHDLMAAAQGAHVIYTDTWVSMGQDDEADQLRTALEAYRVDDAVMAAADPKAIFMHCLPAHRGEEVTASVIDGPQSLVFDEAENRLHAQKALLALLLEGVPW